MPYWAASSPTATCPGPVIMTRAFRLHTDHPVGEGKYCGRWFVRSIRTRSGRGGSVCHGWRSSCTRGMTMGLLHCTLLSVVNRTCCPSAPPPPITQWDETGEAVDGLHRSNQTSRSALDTFHCGLWQAAELLLLTFQHKSLSYSRAQMLL